LENLLLDLSYDVIGELNINTKEITAEMDFDSMIDRYIQNSYEPDYDRAEGSGYSMMSDDIDDLFERS